MRTIKDFKLQNETFEDQRKAGRYNPALELIFRDKKGFHTVKIGAGTSDRIYVFREDWETIVLSINSGLNYAGIEVFNGREHLGEKFVQYDYEIQEYLGIKDVDDLTEINVAKRLYNHIP